MLKNDPELCISGVIGTAPKMQATIKVFPRHYNNLSAVYKRESQTIHQDSYQSYIDTKFKTVSDPEVCSSSDMPDGGASASRPGKDDKVNDFVPIASVKNLSIRAIKKTTTNKNKRSKFNADQIKYPFYCILSSILFVFY